MIEKIQTSLVNTPPVEESDGAGWGWSALARPLPLQSAVTNMTNELLRKNAEASRWAPSPPPRKRNGAWWTSRALRKTNEDLISTLDEVMKIQTEGRQKRREAEVELTKIEGDLRQKLMELRH